MYHIPTERSTTSRKNGVLTRTSDCVRLKNTGESLDSCGVLANSLVLLRGRVRKW